MHHLTLKGSRIECQSAFETLKELGYKNLELSFESRGLETSLEYRLCSILIEKGDTFLSSSQVCLELKKLTNTNLNIVTLGISLSKLGFKKSTKRIEGIAIKGYYLEFDAEQVARFSRFLTARENQAQIHGVKASDFVVPDDFNEAVDKAKNLK